MKVYEKPVVSVDAGMTEGVYAASGAGELRLAIKQLLLIGVEVVRQNLIWI